MVYITNKRIIILTVILALTFIFPFLPPISLRLKTIGVSFNLLIPQGAWRPLELLIRDPIQEEYQIQSTSGRALTVRVYRPQSRAKKSRTAMIIYTPFIGGGLDDPRLVNLAETFTRAGFITAVPWRDEDRLVIGVKDVDDIISTALFIINKQELNVDAFGFFGISYGNGPMIAAAADERIRDAVDFIVSFGGYYDFQNALEFVSTGIYAYKDIASSREPHPYAREIAVKTLEYYNTDTQTLLNAPEFEQLRQALSPSRYVSALKADFFIMHSTDDPYISYTESMRLADALGSRLPVTFALTTLFEHGTYKPLTFGNILRHYLPSLGDFYNFIFTLLAKYL